MLIEPPLNKNTGFNEISKKEHLLWFFSKNELINVKFKLFIDIDFDNEFIDMQNATLTNVFFDGNNKTIKNLNITNFIFGSIDEKSIIRNIKIDNYNHTLIYKNKGTILNSSFKNCYLYKKTRIGYRCALAGINYGTIKSCSFNSIHIINKQNNETHIGGIVAELYNPGSIIFCSVDNITIDAHNSSIIGGIAGLSSGSIEECYVYGIDIKGGLHVGGITGRMFGGNISSCFVNDIIKMNGGIFVGILRDNSNKQLSNNTFKIDDVKSNRRYTIIDNYLNINVKNIIISNIYYFDSDNTSNRWDESYLPKGLEITYDNTGFIISPKLLYSEVINTDVNTYITAIRKVLTDYDIDINNYIIDDKLYITIKDKSDKPNNGLTEKFVNLNEYFNNVKYVIFTYDSIYNEEIMNLVTNIQYIGTQNNNGFNNFLVIIIIILLIIYILKFSNIKISLPWIHS